MRNYLAREGNVKMYIIVICTLLIILVTVIVTITNSNDILNDLNKMFDNKSTELNNKLIRIELELSKNHNFDISKLKDVSIEEKAVVLYELACLKNDNKNKLKLKDTIQEYNSFIDFYQEEVENNSTPVLEEKIIKMNKIVLKKQADK
ncbi:hypothetical protein [Mycoplasma sp. P36-A1]|uniref:hypothetical protein n=1 Tax=Mycoplasma sp. P36-A1 TaxID=3252900 RepID=UPI003C2B2518